MNGRDKWQDFFLRMFLGAQTKQPRVRDDNEGHLRRSQLKTR